MEGEKKNQNDTGFIHALNMGRISISTKLQNEHRQNVSNEIKEYKSCVVVVDQRQIAYSRSR